MPTEEIPMKTVDIDGLDQLIEDARHMPTAMLPRPRSEEPRTVVDLTEHEVRISAATADLAQGYDDYSL
jgi:hypothetical protein